MVEQEFVKNAKSVSKKLLRYLRFISISFIATALNSLASTAFTREGQHLSLIKFIPVPFETQLYAKAVVSTLFTYPMLLLSDIRNYHKRLLFQIQLLHFQKQIQKVLTQGKSRKNFQTIVLLYIYRFSRAS